MQHVEIGLRSVEGAPISGMVAVEEVPSWNLSDHKALLEEPVAVGSVFRQCFLSSQRPGPEEAAHAGEAQLEGQGHPIVAQVGLRRRSGTPADERLVASGRCVDWDPLLVRFEAVVDVL